jgi:hypothetical protein
VGCKPGSRSSGRSASTGQSSRAPASHASGRTDRLPRAAAASLTHPTSRHWRTVPRGCLRGGVGEAVGPGAPGRQASARSRDVVRSVGAVVHVVHDGARAVPRQTTTSGSVDDAFSSTWISPAGM